MSHVPQNIQSPYVAADFWAKWNSVNPRMALFVQITPQSFWTGASAVGFTSNTRNMTLPGRPGITFYSRPGITPSVVEQALGESSSVEMTAIYQTGLFERGDVLAGKWNFAEVEVFSACWDNTNLGELLHFRGNLGEFKDYQTFFTAEGRGLIGRLNVDGGFVTQRTCRVVEFGDSTCGKDLTGTITINGTAYKIRQASVTGSPGPTLNQLIFNTTGWDGNDPLEADFPDYLARFANGKIKALSGANAGVSREIAAAVESIGGWPYLTIYLKRGFPIEITGSGTYQITMGCTRTLEDCRRFANAANFRGEPFVPGLEAANRIPPGS